MPVSTKFSDSVAELAQISPQALTGTDTTGWIKADGYALYQAKVRGGTLAAADTIDAKLEQATDGSGTGAKDVTGKAITQIVDTSDDSSALINLAPSELDIAGGFYWFRLSVTGASAALVSGSVDGKDPKYAPASDNDGAHVIEIV